MTASCPQRIRKLTIVALIVAMVVPAFVACRLFSSYADRQTRGEDADFAVICDALDEQTQALSAGTDVATISTWVQNRARLPYVALLALYDEADRPISVGCDDPQLRRVLTPLWTQRPTRPGPFTTKWPGHGPVSFEYLSRRVAAGGENPRFLGMLVVRYQQQSAFGPFYFTVLLLAASALALCVFLIDTVALCPLTRFITVARAALHARRSRGATTAPESLTGLLDAIAHIQEENDDLRRQAQNLHQSVDRRVDSMTKHITRELRNAFKQASTDQLTGLGNRRVLDDNLGMLIKQSLDANVDLSLILLDLDRFKALNDTHGHQAGDDALRFIGGLLAGCCRDDDIAVRIGGDEFVLLLPGVHSKDAQRIAARLSALFRQRCSEYKLDPPVSMSAGVVSLKDFPTRDPTQFLAGADQALYAVKQAGRDGTRIFVPGSLIETSPR